MILGWKKQQERSKYMLYKLIHEIANVMMKEILIIYADIRTRSNILKFYNYI